MDDNADADGIIICVPTPTTENGICDSSIIANILDTVPVGMKVLIKSTITPAIAEELDKLYHMLSIT
jgi:UDP-N-acetyl-D-mannosaminuronate dehydrogenase